MEEQRIKATEAPYPDDVQKDFDTIMPPGMPPLNLFRTVAKNPRVLHRMITGGLLDRGSISIQDREIVILRTCGICGAEYEWGVHVAGFAAKAEINQNQIDNTHEKNIKPDLWSDKNLCILALVDQLHETQTCDDELWMRLKSFYQDDQLIELVMLTGLYHAVSFTVNSLKIENESFAPTFRSS